MDVGYQNYVSSSTSKELELISEIENVSRSEQPWNQETLVHLYGQLRQVQQESDYRTVSLFQITGEAEELEQTLENLGEPFL